MESSSLQVFSTELLASENGLLASVVRPLERLLENGCAIIQDKAVCELLQGLAYPCDDGRHWVASERLLNGVAELGDNSQLVAAIMASDVNFRQPWLNVIASRCQEAAQLSEPLQLVERIHQLGAASEWVEQALPKATQSATCYSSIERALLGMQADNIGAIPVLIRVLAMAHRLSQWQSQALPVLGSTALQGERADIDWVTGRLLSAPQAIVKYNPYLLITQSSEPNNRSTNQNKFDQSKFDQLPLDAAKARSDAALNWVLTSPWALLLTATSYEQDIWSSEGLGGLMLELPAGQNSLKPSLVQVLVLNNDGDEVLCGSLARFVKRVLAELSMALFPAAISDNELDQQLGGVIELLIRRQVWQHRDGISGALDYYQINPQFADACYRMKGQRAFALYGKNLRTAIRTQAQRWRQEQQSMISPTSATAISLKSTVGFLKDVS